MARDVFLGVLSGGAPGSRSPAPTEGSPWSLDQQILAWQEIQRLRRRLRALGQPALLHNPYGSIVRDQKLIPGLWVELRPREPKPPEPGMVMLFHIERVDLPYFGATGLGSTGYEFRVDENLELCVRLVDHSVWEIMRVGSADQLSRPAQ